MLPADLGKSNPKISLGLRILQFVWEIALSMDRSRMSAQQKHLGVSWDYVAHISFFFHFLLPCPFEEMYRTCLLAQLHKQRSHWQEYGIPMMHMIWESLPHHEGHTISAEMEVFHKFVPYVGLFLRFYDCEMEFKHMEILDFSTKRYRHGTVVLAFFIVTCGLFPRKHPCGNSSLIHILLGSHKLYVCTHSAVRCFMVSGWRNSSIGDVSIVHFIWKINGKRDMTYRVLMKIP